MTLGVTGKLVLAFVTLLLGVVLITSIATQGLAVTDKKVISNEVEAFTPTAEGGINTTEVHTVTNAPTGWKVDDCPLTSVTIGNASDDFTLTTDYTLTASAGTFLLLNTAVVNGSIGADNNTYVDYTYCGDDYMNIGWGRTMINLVAGFFALAILGAAIGLFYSVGKDTGII